VIVAPAKLCAVACVTCRSLADEVVLTNGPHPDRKGPGVFGALDVDDPVSTERTTQVVHAVGAFLGIAPVPVTP